MSLSNWDQKEYVKFILRPHEKITFKGEVFCLRLTGQGYPVECFVPSVAAETVQEEQDAHKAKIDFCNSTITTWIIQYKIKMNQAETFQNKTLH